MNTPSDVYTHGHHESVLRSHTWRTAENSSGYLLEHLKSGMDLLDVGCGPGTITVDLARRVAPGRVTGIDRSADVVAKAGTYASEQGADVRFETGDVYALAYDDASFDVVHAHQVLQHLSDPVAALKEMRRVLRSGGVLAARDADYSSFGWGPLDPRLDRWLEIYRAVARRNDGEPDAGRFLKKWALDAGFSDVQVTSSYVDVRRSGVLQMVGQSVGGSDHDLATGGAGDLVRDRGARRVGRHCSRVAGVGDEAGCYVCSAAWGGDSLSSLEYAYLLVLNLPLA